MHGQCRAAVFAVHAVFVAFVIGVTYVLESVSKLRYLQQQQRQRQAAAAGGSNGDTAAGGHFQQRQGGASEWPQHDPGSSSSSSTSSSSSGASIARWLLCSPLDAALAARGSTLSAAGGSTRAAPPQLPSVAGLVASECLRLLLLLDLPLLAGWWALTSVLRPGVPGSA
jgi:hypothetical protein